VATSSLSLMLLTTPATTTSWGIADSTAVLSVASITVARGLRFWTGQQHLVSFRQKRQFVPALT
jgi:hypothetical protein